MIFVSFYGKHDIIAAEPNITFRDCMVKAQQYNNRPAKRQSFAACMPTIKELD
jgi:hypothetical protein